MLLVPTYVATSKIHGLGLFAAEPIPAGTVVWRYDPRLDRWYDVAEVATLPATARAYVEKYGFRRDGVVVLCGDDGRFVNHAARPNCREARALHGAVAADSVAARPIAKGEEITEDYRSFDEDGAP